MRFYNVCLVVLLYSFGKSYNMLPIKNTSKLESDDFFLRNGLELFSLEMDLNCHNTKKIIILYFHFTENMCIAKKKTVSKT